MRCSKLTGVLVAGTLLALAACQDRDTQSPLAPEPQLARSADSGPELIPNGVPYRDATYTHATGRSGGATLTARALQGMDGAVTLEVTTGELDSWTAPPLEIQKLQVKPLDDAGEPLTVLNYNRVGTGSAEYRYPGLQRHSRIQVQGNVRTANVRGKERTGVITLRERVNLRPDLRVADLMAPAEVGVDEMVDISATVTEVNGDVGATANCLLRVDGVEADRVQGMTVQEGDAVSCLFSTQFSSPGTYALEVVADSVVPGDWDTGNNSVSGSIEVLEDGQALQGFAHAGDNHYVRSEHQWGWATYPHGYETEWDYDRQTTLHRQLFWVDSWGPSAGYSSAATFTLDLSTDGVPLRSITTQSDDHWTGYGYRCTERWLTSPRSLRFMLCEYDQGPRTGGSEVRYYVQSIAGTVAYLGTGYDRYRYGTGAWRYRPLTYFRDYGQQETWGSNLEVDLTATAGPTYTTSVSIPLVSYVSIYSIPERCSSFNEPWGQGAQCWEVYSHQEGGRRGSLYFQP